MTGPRVLLDSLPAEGLLCVEASAGTGKTHLLSTLAVRWLVEADDVRVAELLVVTYTVVAAAELRGRIRARLAEVRDRLRTGTECDDPFLERLAARDDAAAVLARAERALAEFDTASISTIHGFAKSALGSAVGAVGPGDERRHQAVADVLAAASFEDGTTLFDAKDTSDEAFDALVRLSVDNPDLGLAPLADADVGAVAATHRDAVGRAIALFDARGRRDGVLTYANLLTELAGAITEDDAPLLGSLRRRFKVGLIDEFQDTDPTQWRIFERLFLEAPGRALVVVGDPKQAIYGFRGADVDTYLRARERAADETSPGALGVEELTTNYRSDAPLLAALNGVFKGSCLDEAGMIAYVAVEAAPGARAPGVRRADGTTAAPLALRVSIAEGPIGARRRTIAEECAAEAASLLDAGVTDRDGGERAVSEDDVVVLCESGTQFSLLREAFLRRGIRTTVARSDDVLTSPAALDVAVVLRALRDPSDGGAVAAVAHSWCGGGGGGADGVAHARARLATWGEALSSRGVAALARSMTDPRATPGLLADPRGERLLTDVQHLFELLAATAPPNAGAAQLYESLAELVAGAVSAAGEDELRARRIETDAPAVRLMTVHGAKGLEYDVVLCPFIQRVRDNDRDPTIWRDAHVGGRLLDAGGGEAWDDPRLEAPTAKDRTARAGSAVASENRRLLYVALTRARHRTVVWWLPAHTPGERRRDELTSLLLDRDDDHRPVLRPRAARADVAAYDLRGPDALTEMRRHLGHLVDDGLLELDAVAAPATQAAPHGAARASRGLADVGTLGVAHLGRSLRVRAPRCSFSSLVADHDQATTLDVTVGDAGADDEGDGADEDAAPGGPADRLGALRGTSFGSAVHEALDEALTRADGVTFEDAAHAALDAALRRHAMAPDDQALHGLLAAAAVPIEGGAALRSLARDDVATELRFALPVAAGVDLAAVARLVLEGDGDGPFAAWAEALAVAGRHRDLAATLVGSIDLVTSLSSRERYHVIDYKTNVVRGADGYAREGLRSAMRASDYPLQALVYLVALHRYLRWRIAEYDPAQHLGAAHYLFLRGMREGSGDGVCTWTPGAATVAAASDLLAVGT